MPKFVQKSREEVLNASMALTSAERMANKSGSKCCTTEFRPTRNGPCAEVVAAHGALRRLASLEATSEAGDGAGALPGFFPLTPKPGRGDWLAERDESGQTFTSYAKQTPVNVATPHATFNTILIVLISGSPADAVAAAENTASSLTFSPQLQHDLRVYIEAFYHPLRVEFIEAALQQPKNSAVKAKPSKGKHLLSLPVYPSTMGVPRLVVNEAIEAVVQLKTRDPALARRVLITMGLTMYDLSLDKEGASWVYGAAVATENSGMFSLARFHPSFCGRDPMAATSDESTILRRACKVVSHELGHLFGLRHCTDFLCLMNGANHVDELNRQPLLECPACTLKLTHTLRWDATRRYANLHDVAGRLGFAAEAEFLRHVTLPVLQSHAAATP
jgi:predicted Zn-dependent protease